MRKRLSAIAITILMIVMLIGNTVSANSPMPIWAYFKVKGLPEDTEWVFEILVEPDETRGNLSPEYMESRKESLKDSYGEVFERSEEAFDEYAQEHNLSRTYLQTYCLNTNKTKPNEFRYDELPIAFGSRYLIALYLPATDELCVSELIEHQRSIENYFIIDCSDIERGSLNVYSPNPNQYRVVSIATRLVFTVVVETLIAFLFFGVRNKKFLAYIAFINLLSNLSFNLIFNRGSLLGLHLFAELALGMLVTIGEVFVIIVESVLYQAYGGNGFKDKGQSWGFSVAANIVSAIGGLIFFFYFDSLIW